MERAFASAVSATPPAPPASPAIGYPRSGDPGGGAAPTKPGPWWYHMITEEIRAVIVAGGLTPAQNDVSQLRDALIALYGPGRPGHTYTANDWVPVANGLIFQWGRITGVAANTDVVWTFPTAFLNASFYASAILNQATAVGQAAITSDVGPSNKTSVNFRVNSSSPPGSALLLAIGS